MILFLKGKGFLVLIYGFIPYVALPLLARYLNENFLANKFPKWTYESVQGIALIISGLLVYFAADTYYIDEQGEKRYSPNEHTFMFIDIKVWSYIFWVLAGATIIDSLT
jgi:hypothetical protein